MNLRLLLISATIALLALVSIHLRSQEAGEAPPDPDPLAPFGQLIGGQWHLDNSYQEFEWGIGRRSVRARGYFLVDGKPKLVSEGGWFWHPGEQQIKGYFTAIDMPVVLFEYTTRFEPDRMVNELRAYGAKGDESNYMETWEFSEEGRIEWTLLQETPEGLQKQMGGTYTRK